MTRLRACARASHSPLSILLCSENKSHLHESEILAMHDEVKPFPFVSPLLVAGRYLGGYCSELDYLLHEVMERCLSKRCFLY